jgi:hypothetical protein
VMKEVMDALKQYANPGFYMFLVDPVGLQTDPTAKAKAALGVIEMNNILAYLTRIVEIREKKLARAKELESKNAGSAHDTECAEIDLLLAKIELESKADQVYPKD